MQRSPVPCRRALARLRRVSSSTTGALAAAVLGFLVITLDAMVVNVARLAIRDDFGGGMTGLQWVMDGYTHMFAALLLSATLVFAAVTANLTPGATSTALTRSRKGPPHRAQAIEHRLDQLPGIPADLVRGHPRIGQVGIPEGDSAPLPPSR
jgi:hypothetical protein